ncbi:MAG: deoxyribodipyrimidine photo-lyase [Proteobacteria bacterium]|nr:deoxyribodipyrimidine photo-lyase [Pseudomonadota bacterium]
MIEPQRLIELNGAAERGGDYVLYWMQQSQREAFNPALEVGVAAANRLGLPLLVGFGLMDDFPEANARHYAFMLEGLADTAQRLRARGIGFVIRRGAPDAVALGLARQAALVVCDHGYLRIQKQWRTHVAAAAGTRVLRVEGDVVVPVGLAASGAQVGARTLRPKLAALRDRFLAPLRRQRPRRDAQDLQVRGDVDLGDIPRLLGRLSLGRAATPVSGLRGGYTQARARLDAFIRTGLRGYVAARARPAEPQVSMLSPYLHFGQISPVEVALAVAAAPAPHADRDSFLEELVVRRELAANFVDNTREYDRYECIPAWAQRTLGLHARDPRPVLYSYEDLAAARTHDAYWNAATREMLATGYMQNYMRMYWGKKVLEWSASPREAYAVLLQLNNTYFIDGRDPSSFANVGWVFGLHDRPWPERAVFGNVRYMNAAGLERKSDIKAYARRWGAAALQ